MRIHCVHLLACGLEERDPEDILSRQIIFQFGVFHVTLLQLSFFVVFCVIVFPMTPPWFLQESSLKNSFLKISSPASIFCKLSRVHCESLIRVCNLLPLASKCRAPSFFTAHNAAPRINPKIFALSTISSRGRGIKGSPNTSCRILLRLSANTISPATRRLQPALGQSRC